MAKINHITHKKSSVANKAPNVGDILDGEIAVNYAKNTERMYIKNNAGEIIPFSSDHIIKGYIDNLTESTYSVMGRGYGVSNPNLARVSLSISSINAYGSKEALNKVLKHYKMGLFKNGALVKECAPCRITKAVDGSEIKIDGSEGDIMLYTDTPIYRDRCSVTGVTVTNSSATTHNIIGLGLTPHQIGWKEAKKMNPFAFTPGYVQFDGHEYRSCYNTSFSGSASAPNNSYFTTSLIRENGAKGYPVMGQSALDNMQRSRNKGKGYQGIFYEFYEMWLIAMYLELGSLRFNDIDSFGEGCTYSIPSAQDWISGGSSGILIKGGEWDGTDEYNPLHDLYGCIEGLIGANKYNFEEALESQRFVDALVKSNLADKVDGKTVLEYDDDVNKKGYIKVSKNVDLASGSGMKEGKKYYIIRNVPNCQGIGDGVMTYVLNVFFKTKFKDDYKGNTDYRGKTVIFKFSYPTYRGLELFSGARTHIEGINYVVGNRSGKRKSSIWYTNDYTDIKYKPSPSNSAITDYVVSIDEDIPYIKGFVKGGEYDDSHKGRVKSADYNVSLYCATECGDDASFTSYECGYVGVVYKIGDGYKRVYESVVGGDANTGVRGRALYAGYGVDYGADEFAGGFSLGNPSL